MEELEKSNALEKARQDIAQQSLDEIRKTRDKVREIAGVNSRGYADLDAQVCEAENERGNVRCKVTTFESGDIVSITVMLFRKDGSVDATTYTCHADDKCTISTYIASK